MSTPPSAVWAVYRADSEPFELARLERVTGAREAVVPLFGTLPDDDKHIALGFGSAWIASGHQVVHRVDLRTARVTAHIELSHHLEAIAVADGSVWVSSDLSNGTLFRIDPRTNTATTTVSPTHPRNLAAVEEGLLISHGSRVTLLDTRSMRTVATHDLGGFVLDLCAGGGAAWAATLEEAPLGSAGAGETGLLFRLDADHAVPVARIEGRAAGLAFGLGAAWVAADRLQRVSATDGAQTTIDERVAMPTVVGDALWAERISYTGEDPELVRIDPATGQVEVLATGDLPSALIAE